MSDPLREQLVVVTGASGFIGRHLTESLLARGVRVRGVTRRPGTLARGIEEAIVPDVLDREAVRRAVRGAGAVVHLAARVHARRDGTGDPRTECQRTNVEGTSVLIEEAVAAEATKFVFASSVKAVANECDEALSPETPPQPEDAYGESKLEAERLIRVVAGQHGLSAPLLRLPVCYGPGMKANMASLFRAVERGIPLPLASVKNRRSFAYVGNAVGAIESLLAAPLPGSDVFYVSDEEDLSTPELVRRVARSLGKPARLLPAPPGLLRAGGSTWGLLSRIAGLHFSNESVTAVLGSLFVDTSSLREMTGFKPHISVDKGMSLTAASYRAGRAGRAG